jgi:hypothetical protein
MILIVCQTDALGALAGRVPDRDSVVAARLLLGPGGLEAGGIQAATMELRPEARGCQASFGMQAWRLLTHPPAPLALWTKNLRGISPQMRTE